MRSCETSLYQISGFISSLERGTARLQKHIMHLNVEECTMFDRL